MESLGIGLESMVGMEETVLYSSRRLAEGGSRKALFIGATDTGKTYLLRRWANELACAGKKVAVLDFDLGQSTVGPPGCLGLHLPWGKGGDPLFPVAMVFLGFLSPAFDVGSVVEAGLRLKRRVGELGYDALLVDTSGMIDGALAALLKRSKIRALRPDLLVVLDMRGETDNIFSGLEEDAYGELLKLTPSPEARRRSREERAAYRRELFLRYFDAGREMTLGLRRLRVVSTSPRVAASEETLGEGRLVGLNDAAGITRALARVLRSDEDRVRIVTPFLGDEEEIAALSVGSLVLEEDGSLCFLP